MKYSAKIISSLEKCFINDDITLLKSINNLSCLKNEKLNFQIAYTVYSNTLRDKKPAFFMIKSDLNDFIKIYKVESVPCRFPVMHNTKELDYQKKEPYLYPDLLDEYIHSDNIYFVPNVLQSLFIEINLDYNSLFHGEYTLECIFFDSDNEILYKTEISIEIINSYLDDEKIKYTQWFHSDCLSSYYNVKPLSEKHFKIIDNFMKTASEYGINTILTPVLTPPLDTKIGGERPTIQLIGIRKSDLGYEYNYDLLDKWINLCRKNNIEFFEISHFFTQWGAKHAPKIIATVNGRKKRIFGWDTDSTSDDYVGFLRDFIKNLIIHLKKLNIDKKCIFHISDEPNEKTVDNYKAAKNTISDLLEDYMVTDALSSIEFYKQGIVKKPIPSTDKIHDFIELKVKNLWAYYCGGQYIDVSNRYIAMPSYRNRIIGAQLYKYDIEGFLHWGYNFYYNQYSRKLINPFLITDADFFAPSGDAYTVYPGNDYNPLKSLRLLIFNEALQDIRAFKTLEKLTSYSHVISIIEEEIDELTFNNYPRNNDYILNLRKKINREISQHIKDIKKI